VGPKNHILDGDQDRTNLFAAVAIPVGDAAFCQITLGTSLALLFISGLFFVRGFFDVT